MFQWATPFASAARTATPTSQIIPVPMDASFVELVISCTAIVTAPSVVFNIDFQDADGTWTSFLASAAVTGTGTSRMRIGPTIVAAANVAANASLPSGIRIRPVHGNADSITYSVGLWFRGGC